MIQDGFTVVRILNPFVDGQLGTLNMIYFAFKLVCLTLLVTASWLLVTFLTKPDDRETLDEFVKTVQPGGIWQFKFGSLFAGLLMSMAWVALMIFTVKKMAALEIHGSH